ncbi:topoisomerase C-terminal repeat-containing protein, partial [Sinorhizobium medicae]
GDPRICQVCGTGKLSLKLGKYGAFVGCSNYPECNYTRQLSSDSSGDAEAAASNEPQSLGKDPHTGEEITLRNGRFGPYVQRGDGKEAKRASLPKGWTPATIDHEKALALLSLPRDLGPHPETGKMISAGIGRYGPFVLHNGTYANLESVEDVFSIGLNRATSVLADKQSKGAGGAGGRTGAAAVKELGEHPDGGAITVRDGRYGPYVNWGKVNATLPRGKDPQSVTVEEALAFIAERAAKGGVTKGKTAKGKSAGRKQAGTKTAKAAGTATAEKPKRAAKTKTKSAAKAKKD